MINLFTIDKIDLVSATKFWTWFEEKEKWIISEAQKPKNDEFDFNDKHIWEIDKYLTPVLPYVKRELEFMMGYNDEIKKWELYLFDFGDEKINRDYEILKSMMPKKLQKRWEIIIEN